MTEPDFKDTQLDDLFDLAKRTPLTPSGDLMARILADADAQQVRPAMNPAQPEPFWQRWLPSFAAFGGLATAAVAGVWIGVNPALISDDLASLLGASVDDGYWLSDASGGFLTDMVDG